MIKAKAEKEVNVKDSSKEVNTSMRKPGSGTVVNLSKGGVGRRKSSVARVWIRPGKGIISVNDRTLQEYFCTQETQADALKALAVCSAKGLYNIKINVEGGGPCSQAGAVRLGIARALLATNDSFKAVLTDNGLLTVDSRVKERKKPGQPGARRKFQFVKR